MFENLSDKLLKTLRDLRGHGKLTEANIEQALRQVRMNFLEADVHYQVAKDFIDRVQKKAIGQDVLESLTPSQGIVKIIYEELKDLLGSEARHLDLTRMPPVPILLVGLQGSGKTTTAGKLAKYLKGKGRRPYLVPADVQRPAAIEQLQQLAKRLDVPVYPTNPGDKPVKVAERGVEEATNAGADTVIIDTAGRLHIDSELMDELAKIVKATNPAEILLVADAMTGQDAVNIAKTFNDTLQLTGIILTKMDGNARAGAALSIKTITGRPIVFVGMGEGLDALEPFYPDRVAGRILDMGDILSLAEKAQEIYDEKSAQDLVAKIQGNDFTIEDFAKQLKQMKKLGSMESLLGMLPGFKKVKNSIDINEVEKELKRKEAIVGSMTIGERKNYRILNGSRRKRIALGSGTRVQDVNQFIREFSQMQKMMGKFGKSIFKGMAGMMGGFKR